MSHRLWQRYQAVGERLATCEPDLFPTVVALLELLADDYALPSLIEDAVAASPSRSRLAAMSSATLGDLLCLADGALADVTGLDARLRQLSVSERIAAELWARTKVAARGVATHHSEPPECVTALRASAGLEAT